MSKEYLSEEKCQKIKKVLIIIGCISLVIALVLFVSSFLVEVPEMGEDGWFEAKQQVTLLRFFAFPFGLAIPLITFSIAFRREMLAFSAQQVMPVAQEGAVKMAPTAGKVAKEVVKGVKEGLKEEE